MVTEVHIFVILFFDETGAGENMSKNKAKRIFEGITLTVRFNCGGMMDIGS